MVLLLAKEGVDLNGIKRDGIVCVPERRSSSRLLPSLRLFRKGRRAGKGRRGRRRKELRNVTDQRPRSIFSDDKASGKEDFHNLLA